MIWQIFYWPMAKSLCTVISGPDIQLMFFLQFIRTPSLQCEEAKFVCPAEPAVDPCHLQVEQP